MKQKPRKLSLNKETLQNLDEQHLRGAIGGRVIKAADTSQSIQSGETYCWCTETCNNCCGANTH